MRDGLVVVLVLATGVFLWGCDVKGQFTNGGMLDTKAHLLNAGILKGQKASGQWIWVEHPTLPIGFEVPDNASVQYDLYPDTVHPFWKSGKPMKTDYFGIREVHRYATAHFAIEWYFFLVTDKYRGVGKEDLNLLRSRLGDPSFTKDFIERVFFLPEWPAKLEEMDDEAVGSRRGRRFNYLVGGGKVAGAPHGELIVVPLDSRSALVICSKFSEEILPEEENEIFPRIVRSVRILKHDKNTASAN